MQGAFKKTAAIFFIATSILSSGCASTKKDPVDERSLSLYQEKMIKENQITQEVLAKAALLSAKSLAVFVRTEQAVHQPNLTAEQIRQARFQNEYIPVNMEVMLDYASDTTPEPLISAIATNTGYQVEYVNERPPIGKAVTIGSGSRKAIKYINIIKQQASGYIDNIIVDDKYDRKVIYVFYSKF